MSAPVWQVSSEFGVMLETWENETLVYHQGSGQTHLLNEIAVCVFDCLREQPSNFSVLMQSLSEQVEVEDTESFEQQVYELLGTFETLGLVDVCYE